MREIIDVLITIIWFIWTGAILPQIYKIYKRKSVEDLSVASLWINFLCAFISIFYGIYVKLFPLISVNIFGTFLFSILLGQYYKYQKK
jgi:MtN3 and saliva related transmembrane protein